MKTRTLRLTAVTAWVAVTSWLVFSLAAHAQATNNWTSTTSGEWGAAGNWSAGAPSLNFSYHYITNATTKTVEVTSTLPASTLTISNLTLSAPGSDVNTLYVHDLGEGPLTFSKSLTLLSGGALWLGNAATVRVGVVEFSGFPGFRVAGNASINGGSLIATNYWTSVGGSGGQMTVSNGLVLLNGTSVGGTVDGSLGRLTVAGGTNQVLGELLVGYGDPDYGKNATGMVLVTGGQFIATNDTTYLGTYGDGRMTVSNGLALLKDISLGREYGSHGSLTVAGGTNQVLGYLLVGDSADNSGSSGRVLVTGGQLIATNGGILLSVGGGAGIAGNGQMTVSNGLVLVRDTTVFGAGGSVGSLTVAGGTNQILGSLSVGGVDGSGASVLVTGGQLIVTNDSTFVNAYGGDASAQMTVSNGLVLLKDTYVGSYGFEATRGSLTVAGGTNQIGGSLVVGHLFSGATGIVTVTGGNLLVTNATGTASLDVRRGTLALNGGVVTVDNFYATNGGSSVVNFNGGTLNTAGSTVSNGVPFRIGNGTDAATLNLVGGTHSFADGLIVTNNAQITGIGTIVGDLANPGTLAPGHSAGTMTIAGRLILFTTSVLEMELSGTNAGAYDQLVVNGELIAAGALDVALIDGYTPNAGDLFRLFDYDTVSGGFAQMNLPYGLANWNTSHLLAPSSDPLSGSLIFIPEPDTCALLLAALGGLLVRRRRRP